MRTFSAAFLVVLTACGSSERIERLEARVAALEKELGIAPPAAERPRSAPMETRTVREPEHPLKKADARFDELTLPLADYEKLESFALSSPALRLSRTEGVFSALLRGPAQRHLKQRKHAEFMSIRVPLSPELLAREDLRARLTRSPSIELMPDLEEMRRGRKVDIGDYLDLLGKKKVLFAFVDDKELTNDGRRLFALTRPEEPGLEWIQCALPAAYARGSDAYASLSAGLEAWRFDDEVWTREVQDAVLACLVWLARHQGVDGLWSATRSVERCREPRGCGASSGSDALDVGLTGLSLLAFLGAGYSPESADTYQGIVFGNSVGGGLRALLEVQSPAGWFGTSSERGVVQHALALFAILEAYRLTEREDFEKAGIRGLSALAKAQNADAGWGDVPGRSDGFATGMALLGLEAARRAGLLTLNDVETRGWFFLRKLQDASGRVGYAKAGVDASVIPGLNDVTAPHPTLSLFPAILDMDRTTYPVPMPALEMEWAVSWRSVDYLHLWLFTAARYRMDGPSGPLWKAWNAEVKNFLVKSQKTAAQGCENGSWEPGDAWSRAGGRVYATAVNALTLEIYYRFANVPWAR